MSEFRATKKVKASSYVNISNENLVMDLLNLASKNLTINTDSNGLSKFRLQKNSLIDLKYIMRNMELTGFDINSDYFRKFYNVT